MKITVINQENGIGIEKLYSVILMIESQWQHSMADDKASLMMYAKKIYENAVVLGVYNDNSELIGLSALYVNDHLSKSAYITYIALLEKYTHCGLGTKLISHFEQISKDAGMTQLLLEVADNNNRAISFYRKNGFILKCSSRVDHSYMIKRIC